MEVKEIFKNGKVLTLELAKNLIGKKIVWTHPAYNPPTVNETTIGGIMSELDYYEGQPMNGFKSRAEYWRSYMTEKQLSERERTLMIVDENGKGTYMRCYLYSGIYDMPTFTCSDEDREVYFIAID